MFSGDQLYHHHVPGRTSRERVIKEFPMNTAKEGPLELCSLCDTFWAEPCSFSWLLNDPPEQRPNVIGTERPHILSSILFYKLIRMIYGCTATLLPSPRLAKWTSTTGLLSSIFHYWEIRTSLYM